MKQLNWYQIFGNTHTIPDGRTVTPTDDIQIWLNCANIWDKAYTTLAEVLADTDTLLALISSNNAVDYMVRSTTWAVAQALVPTMTSNTTPEGECFAGQGMSASEPAWKAFDGLTTTRAGSSAGATELSVGYKPVNPIKPYKAYIWSAYSGNYQYKVQYSDNGSTWTDACSYVVVTDSNPYISLSVDAQHSYWRIIRKWSSADSGIVRELQFYSISITDSSTAMTYIGLNNYASNTLLADSTWNTAIQNSPYFESVDNVKVPAMTSATTPEGEVSARGSYGSQVPYMAFDNNTGTAWRSQSLSTSDHITWIQYKFSSKRKIYRAYWYATHSTTDANLPNASIKIQASNDNSTFTDIYSESLGNINNKEFVFTFTCDTEYLYWRLWIDANVRSLQPSVYAMEVQFYGREDV